MFVRKGKFDSKVLLDPGPASSRGKMSLSETSFVNGMDRRAMENCVNKTVLVEEANTEPDSSVNYVDEGSTFRPVRKRVKESPVSVEIIKFESVDRSDVDCYHKSIVALASEKKSSKRAETDSASEDGKDSRQIYPASVPSGNSVIPEPIETSIVQNVSKLTKNFSLPGIQSVSSVNQTLWLPTIIASSAVNDNEDRLYEDETETSTTTVSQIILTGTGPHFTSHSVRNSLMSSKPCQISNHKFSPKVQILGGVTIPKQNSLPNNNQSSVASANVKTIHANYVNQSEMSHVNSSISSGSSKQIISNSFLNQISNKMPFATNRAQCGPVQVKCSSVINSVQMKSIPASVNRSINKINNNNNNNNNNSSKIESSTVQIPDQSGHVFSRVISTPKISLQSSGRVVKSGNIQYNQKPVMTETQQNSNIIHTHKVQSAVPVKIIQQQTISSGHKAGFKTVPTSRATIGTTKNVTYNSVSSIPGKGWLQSSSGTVNHVANPKTNSSFHKNITSVVNVQKINSKTPTQKMIVHQPTSQIIMSNSAPLNRINSQHYQAGDTGNAQNIHYVQNYVGTENNNSPSVSCSQAITAQILQSFSQSKIVLPSSVQHLSPTLTSNKRSTVSNRQIHLEDVYVKKSYDQKRQIHGDPNTVLTTDDILGTYEERPRISDDSLPYHFHSLQLVMLDHTYAQTMSNNSINGSNAVPNQPSPVNNNIPVSSPVSPAKAVPHITSTPSNGTLSRQSPITTTSPMLPNNTSSIVQNVTSYQYNSMPAEDDDAASIISSIEGDRDRDIDRAAERHDSDTETAPEGEEEGKTRCVCEFTHDDGYMICCDKCGEWQHVDCMGIDRQNIPDDYMCDRCEPRLIDRKRARSIQIRKREELTGLGSSGSDSSSGASLNNHRNKPIPLGSSSSHKKRPLTVTTYSNTISGVSRTIPTPSQFSPTYTISNPLPVPVVKKVPKRSRRIDNSRKIPKRKLPEKRKRKTSEVSNYRSKYCSVTTSSQISQWSESYELAKTNHYSPELRAKIARYSNRGGNNNPNLANVLTTHLCTTVPHAGSKILIATKDLKENSPIVELRGKYMLSNQHKPQPQLSSRISSQRPGPFLFFYHLPKDSTQICIDTRTYGNEARFVRRSCKPNAELQHCIIKGTLHVYIVTINSIQSNTEISIRHDANGVFQPCACGNPKHCKQPGVNNSSVVHRNNGAASDVCHERRGRTRYSSSSNNISSNAYTKYDIFMKSESPEREKIEDMEIDNVDVMKREVIESIIFDKSEDVITPVSNDESPIIEKKTIEIKSEPVTSTEVPLPDKKIIECVKEEVEIKSPIKEEKPDVVETLASPPIESESEKVIKLEEPINSSIETDCKSPIQNSPKNPINIFSKTKDADKCSKKVSNSRRTSVHSTRSTRASSNTFTASESADEKSDTQCDSKTHGPKEKKKLTREERKMEAIMKAFERMEKAELRRQENRDRQSKRRESDSQPPNSSEKDSKDQHDDQNDDSEPNSKRRRRKKGRSRTVSQCQSQRNRNRLNSIDSDMVTSGEESTSLLSPPVSSSNIINDCYSETTPLNSTENLNYTSQLSDTLVLRESVHRLKVGLSSACLLVEAAVGPLESTFKFPKTKKDMMNEWLNKSPERNSLYDNQSIDYVSSRNTNLSPYGEKDMKKSIDNVMKATKIISRFSGGTISTGSTPEKNYMSEQSEPENLTFNIVDSSATTPDHSPQPYSQLDLKKPELDYQEINISCDKKVPKRFRKGYKSVIDENSSPIKRSLRSNTGIENMYNLDDVSYGNVTPPHDETHVVIPTVDEIRDSEILTAPQPPQHSAKKRWLRQAISEESDSPTAESPPNEMVTPLKKRRLARESLSLEPPYGNCDDTQYSVTPKKDSEITPQNVVNQEINDAKINSIIFNDESAVAPLVNICTDTKLETIDEGSNNAKLLCPAENEDSNCEEMIFENKEINIPPEKCEAVTVNNETSELVLSDLKFNLSHFSILKGKMDSKDDACLENSSVKESHDLVTRDIKSEPVSNINSAETSGNSSPVLDDIDDIKKKIHSFHTENIQILQIRNKKQPKEKRKKVNLTFDLCVLADQTVGVKLKSEKEMNDTLNIENNPCPKDLPLSETPLRGLDHSKSVLETSVNDVSAKAQNPIVYNSAIFPAENPPVPVPVESHAGFKCAPLFSGSFKGEPNPSISQMPDINLIKNAIDMTTSLDIGFKSSNASSSVDEYKNVQEILSHVNQMDSRNSVLLSGVLRDTNRSIVPETNTAPHMTPKTFVGRPNDPRLNPPPVEAPKPIRRKLSITEYRRRHSMVSSNSSDVESIGETTQSTSQNDTSPCNTNSNCMHNDDINQIVGKSIEDSIATDDAHTIQTMIGEMPKTVEDVNSIIGCLPDTSEVETVISEAEPSQLVSNETVESSNLTTR